VSGHKTLNTAKFALAQTFRNITEGISGIAQKLMLHKLLLTLNKFKFL